MNITHYYHQEFRNDLTLFMDMSSPLRYFGHCWHYRCIGVSRVPDLSRAAFLVCLYFTVLVDQAMHAHYRSHYDRFEDLTRYPKFCHGLCQFQHNPYWILVFPIKRSQVSRDELYFLLGPGMELFVDEVISFFEGYMPQISAAEFFAALASDPDVEISPVAVMLDKTIAESVEYRAYDALCRAIKSAGIERNRGAAKSF